MTRRGRGRASSDSGTMAESCRVSLTFVLGSCSRRRVELRTPDPHVFNTSTSRSATGKTSLLGAQEVDLWRFQVDHTRPMSIFEHQIFANWTPGPTGISQGQAIDLLIGGGTVLLPDGRTAQIMRTIRRAIIRYNRAIDTFSRRGCLYRSVAECNFAIQPREMTFVQLPTSPNANSLMS
jgi:hypothetical protein